MQCTAPVVPRGISNPEKFISFDDLGDDSDEGEAAYSPGGTMVVFDSNFDGQPGIDGDLDIWLLLADGTRCNLIDDNADPHLDRFGAWAPDGMKIAFFSDRDDPNPVNPELGLYILDLTNLTVTTVLHPDDFEDDIVRIRACAPSWSPTDEVIAFEALPVGACGNVFQCPDVFTVSTDGLTLNRLTNDTMKSDGYPTYSPDGTMIAFDSNRTGTFGVYVMDADGDNQHAVLTPTNDGFPDWLPNPLDPSNPHLLFMSTRVVANTNVWMVDLDGNNLTQLTTSLSSDRYPAGSPDGQFVVFESSEDGDWDIYRIEL
ncbi:MAG: PD40 domain-containing protein [Deinococcus sp.]|nr:PD40 domain-containing protein [Deinococcus sp.]